MRRIGLPWSETLVRRTLVGAGSAVLAARLALQFGVACMCNGGTHHAHRDHGSGEGSRSGFGRNSHSTSAETVEITTARGASSQPWTQFAPPLLLRVHVAR